VWQRHCVCVLVRVTTRPHIHPIFQSQPRCMFYNKTFGEPQPLCGVLGSLRRGCRCLVPDDMTDCRDRFHLYSYPRGGGQGRGKLDMTANSNGIAHQEGESWRHKPGDVFALFCSRGVVAKAPGWCRRGGNRVKPESGVKAQRLGEGNQVCHAAILMTIKHDCGGPDMLACHRAISMLCS